ncbi:gliding motility-associated peptidyl-prolyl isomerase GldI [Flavobacterium sp. ZB4P23]|uniref:gliding motility-associated peptidyl-prolyl isomerase GldI n=1 Tax=unclassified Flavobacterium TaxID=196869 RepID=UPI000F82BB55|nr:MULTISPECIES: gliding motility-associated peptidyl-prolyl isomerase GldI [unclassified Flavobacterium]RTY71160.1 gliding motility-associated peptidyl-prolyl isomerase GldI [Flavobacterium sp. LB2P53]RTY83386.1 gliding motility-associated peptidyl-prolyl isomerase GldI [Flavobacterium sp. ZB4P23]
MLKFSTPIALVFFLILVMSSCKQHQEARRPLSQASGSFMKKSIQRNKKLVATEEDKIEALIKSDPKIKYLASKKGYWYTYQTRNETDTLTPKKGDVAFFDYEIKDLKGAIIYSEVELRPQIYYVDKQNIMMGLRDGIKLMRKNEKVTFLFPSNMGYGYHGDDKKIGTNQPLICTVTLRDFKSEATYKKENEAPVKTVVLPAPSKQQVPPTSTPKDTINQ